MQLTKVKCPSNKISIKCPYLMIPEFIVVHNTANDASAMSEVSYMLGNNKEVSFHYAVDDYRVVQGIETNRNTWHAGDGNGKGNRKGISIEICYSKSGGERFDKAEKNAAFFIAQLLKERGWGIDKVKKHQDFSQKYCPHRTLDRGWERFLNLIRAELGIASVNVPTITKKPNVNGKTNCTGDITYQSYDNIKKCWLPEVVNDKDYAGNLKNAIGGVRAKCKYGKIYIQTHILNGKWLSTINSNTYSKNSKNGNSYSGIMNKPIDGIKIWSDYGFVEYRVHVKAKNDSKGKQVSPAQWLAWVRKADNTVNGYAGIYGREIDAIQMK